MSNHQSTSRDPSKEPRVDQRSGGIYIERGQLRVRGNVAGRDLIVIHLPALTWLIPIAILVPAFVVAAVLLVPSLIGQGTMTGLFNIAVADFGQINEQGQLVEWKEGATLSQAIFEQISNEFKGIPGIAGIVQVRHQGVGIVRGLTREERAASAKEIAQRLNAHLVIYGNLEKHQDRSAFLPEFFINEIKGAEEILGPDQMGAPVSSSDSLTGLSGSLVLGDALQARTRALTLFTIGLAYLTAHDYDKALERFEQATQVNGWKDTDGKEVVYLFLGTAYKIRAQEGDLARAHTAYQKAVNLNPEYARAYIGLGNVAYFEFTRSNFTNPAKLDEAWAEYLKARNASFKPASAYVDTNLHTQFGNVYSLKAQLGSPEYYALAEAEYQQVITAFEKGATELKSFAATAYSGMGIIRLVRDQNYTQAADYFRKCLANAGNDQELINFAKAQLKEIEALTGTKTP